MEIFDAELTVESRGMILDETVGLLGLTDIWD